ncbi:iron-sulfur cluster assembly scaffold protein [Planctomycetota bacterium]
MKEIETTLKNNMLAGQDDEYFGRLNNPTSASVLKGPCGDEMEFYLYIKNDIIVDVRYHTNGCKNTRVCGYAAAKRAKGKKVTDALSINPAEIINSGECAPEGGRHCAILAVSALYRAIAEYLLMPR